MPKTLAFNQLGPLNTPQEIKDLRQSSFDYHEEYGFPVIHKHRWNEMDLREGRAQRCPLHDDVYDASESGCPYCFGTGYLGGWSDGVIVNVHIGDAPQDVIRFSEQGVLIHDVHPQMTAPWIPEMGDGDMLITASFSHDWDILDLQERFTLREVNAVTMRGPGFKKQNARGKPYRVSQSSQIDRLPYNHPFYEVPVIFNYNDAPEPEPPSDTDPLPPNYKYSTTERAIRITGAETLFRSEASREVRISVDGDDTSTNRDMRVTGKTAGTVIHF